MKLTDRVPFSRLTGIILFATALPLLAADAAGGGGASSAPLGLKLLMRWLHVGTAIALVGGTFFQWFALLPVAGRELEEEVRGRFRDAIAAQWRKIIPWGIVIFIGTGLYNYLAVTRHAHEGESLYHMLFGIKFLLALAVFALASIVSGRGNLAQKLRKDARKWVGVLLLLATLVVLVAGYMKVM